MKLQPHPQARIFVCINEKAPDKNQCLKGEGEKIVLWLKEEVKRRNIQNLLWITRTKCQGYCDPQGTAVIFEPGYELYSSVKFEDVPALFENFIKNYLGK